MTTRELADKRCVPCRGGDSPLKGDALETLKAQLGSEWTVIGEHHLEKTYRFKNFREALAFTNAVGEIAEEEGHHPVIILTWGKTTIRIWTHKIDGLTQSDFVLAAKTERAFEERSRPRNGCQGASTGT